MNTTAALKIKYVLTPPLGVVVVVCTMLVGVVSGFCWIRYLSHGWPRRACCLGRAVVIVYVCVRVVGYMVAREV